MRPLCPSHSPGNTEAECPTSLPFPGPGSLKDGFVPAEWVLINSTRGLKSDSSQGLLLK